MKPKFSRDQTIREIKRFVEEGMAVFPAHIPISMASCSCGRSGCKSIGKHPQTYNGHKNASRDKAVISGWLKGPAFNLCVATGAVSGVFVLDIDADTGGLRTLEELKEKHGNLPVTWRTLTGGGGFHYFFRYPGYSIKSRAGVLPGLDIRGDGGYVVAPPSIHRSGLRYTWDTSCSPDETAIAEAPPWLLELLQMNGVSTRLAQGKPASFWVNFLRDGISEGERNTKITSLAGHLLRKSVDPYVTLTLLEAYNDSMVHPPLDQDELIRCVRSIVRKEIDRRTGACHD